MPDGGGHELHRRGYAEGRGIVSDIGAPSRRSSDGIDPVQFGAIVQAVKTNAENIAKIDKKLDAPNTEVLAKVDRLSGQLDAAHGANAGRISELETFKNNLKIGAKFIGMAGAFVGLTLNWEATSAWMKGLMK